VQFCNEAKSSAYWLVNETLWYETETRPRRLESGNYVSKPSRTRPRRRDRDYILGRCSKEVWCKKWRTL